MELIRGNTELETLNEKLNDPDFLREYKAQHDNVPVAWFPKMIGKSLVALGNSVYGKNPTPLKFRSVEIIARVPYHSWSAAAFSLMTLFFADEKRALRYSDVAKHSYFAQENETMHVVVISHLVQLENKPVGFFRFTFVPVVFSFFYFWWSYILYLINPKYSYQLNYLFEQHAFEQYDQFITQHEASLKEQTVKSEYLTWYGRQPKNLYEFYRSIRNDEIIHRNQSIEEIMHLQNQVS
jgi:hypothetical protein